MVEPGESSDKFKVSGRGELHLSVLIESMRRDGFELGVSKPEVIQKEVNGEIHEPFEQIVIDLEEEHQGSIMEEMGLRKAELKNMLIIDLVSQSIQCENGKLFEFGVEEASCACTSLPIIHNITYLYIAYRSVIPPIAKII